MIRRDHIIVMPVPCDACALVTQNKCRVDNVTDVNASILTDEYTQVTGERSWGKGHW